MSGEDTHEENETTEEEAAPEIWATVGSDKVRIVMPSTWTFEEGKLAKNVSEGMTPVAIEGSLLEGDPDAWLAVLRVSYLRADKEFPRRIAGQEIFDLVKQVTTAIRKASAAVPPTKVNGSGELEGAAESGSTASASQS